MHITTTFIHMDRSEAIEKFAIDKIGSKIKRLSQNPIDAHLRFEVDKAKHMVRLSLKESGSEEIALHGENGDMHAAVLKLAEQLDKLLRRRKDKKIKSRHQAKRELPDVEEDTEDFETLAPV